MPDAPLLVLTGPDDCSCPFGHVHRAPWATLDPWHQSICVHLPHYAWMLFRLPGGAGDELIAMSPTVRCQPGITGVAGPHWREVNAAWDLMRGVACGAVPARLARHTPRTRITPAVQWVLAVYDRVARFGGFTGEAAHLPDHVADLSPEDRRTYDRRLRGRIVL